MSSMAAESNSSSKILWPSTCCKYSFLRNSISPFWFVTSCVVMSQTSPVPLSAISARLYPYSSSCREDKHSTVSFHPFQLSSTVNASGSRCNMRPAPCRTGSAVALLIKPRLEEPPSPNPSLGTLRRLDNRHPEPSSFAPNGNQVHRLDEPAAWVRPNFLPICRSI